MKCPVCENNKDFNLVEDLRDYKMVLCNYCGLIFSNPMKSAPHEYYDAYVSPDSDYGWRWEFSEFFKIPILRTGKLLDVGCGSGIFLNFAKNFGFTVSGIDLNKGAIERARKEYFLENLLCCDILNYLSVNNEKFDIITCFHVIEHLDNPFKFIADIYNLVKSGGYLVISVPNQSSWKFKRIGGRIQNDCPPNHLTRWSMKSLEILLENNNFEIVMIKGQKTSLSYFSDVVNHIREILSLILSSGIASKLRLEASVNIDRRKGEVFLNRLRLYSCISNIKNFLVNISAHILAIFCFYFLKGKIYTDNGLLLLAKSKKITL